ncbi:MAG: hypothetical protein WCO60_19175 [Verrucomicrobiota bacterium]
MAFDERGTRNSYQDSSPENLDGVDCGARQYKDDRMVWKVPLLEWRAWKFKGRGPLTIAAGKALELRYVSDPNLFKRHDDAQAAVQNSRAATLRSGASVAAS